MKYIPLLGVVFLLSGCVSDSKFNELCEKVDSLEREINELKTLQENQTVPDVQVRQDVDKDVIVEQDSEKSEKKEKDITQEQSAKVDEKKEEYSYYIDNMTVEEVVNECIYYFNDLPNIGDTYEKHLSTMKVKPMKYDENQLLYYFYNINSYSNEPERDAICYIAMSGTQTEMDGTIGYSNIFDSEYLSVQIDMYVYGYDRAVAIYDGLYNYLAPYYTQVHDQRESTTWRAGGTLQINNSGYIFDLVRMSKSNDNLFYIETTYRVEK